MRCSGVSPAASVSPLVNPMRSSLTSGEGDVRVSSFMRSFVVGDWPNAARGGGVGLVLKQGGAARGLALEFAVSLEGRASSSKPRPAPP